MSPKQILFDALQGKPTARPAWVPFVGVHGGQLTGKRADEYLQSTEAIVAGLSQAVELYHPDGLPVAFDLQIEAEILGCELNWAQQTPPSVMSHPLMGQSPDPSALPKYDVTAGRLPRVLDALDRVKAKFPEVAFYGLITGPFTLATHLRGNEIFLDMFDDEAGLTKLLEHCANIGNQTARAYIERGAEVIAVVDPMTSQISPEHFEQFVTPHVNAIFDDIRQAGAYSSMFVCGDASRNLEKMCQTRADNVSIDENIPLPTLRNLATEHHKSFGGNLKLTVVLLMGDTDDAKLDALRCIDIGGDRGFVLAPGCDLPYAVPQDNLIAVSQMVHDEYQRQVARTSITAKTDPQLPSIELPHYQAANAVYIDVVTLDSAGCAPCQYMVAGARRAAKKADCDVVVAEHKITGPAGLAAMMKLGVSNIPTLCIDGQVAFSSIIPSDQALAEALQARADAKTSKSGVGT